MLNVITALIKDKRFYDKFSQAVDEWYDFWESGANFNSIVDYVDIDVLQPAPDTQLAAAWVALSKTGLKPMSTIKTFIELLKYIAYDPENQFDDDWYQITFIMDTYLHSLVKLQHQYEDDIHTSYENAMMDNIIKFLMSEWSVFSRR